MANPRVEIESGIVAALQPLKADKSIKWLEAIGGLDYEHFLMAALGAAPFCVVKYVGKSPGMEQGGLVHYSAEVSVMVGVKSFKTLAAQRFSAYELLFKIEERLGGLRLTSNAGPDVYYPIVPGPEQWSELSGRGLEVWEQRYVVQWKEDYGGF